MRKENYPTRKLLFLGILIFGILAVMVSQARAQSGYSPLPCFLPPVSPMLAYPRTAQALLTFPAPTLPVAPAATPAGLSVTSLIPTTTITAVVPLTAITAPVPLYPTYSPITLQAVVPVASAIPSTVNILLSLINSWLI